MTGVPVTSQPLCMGARLLDGGRSVQEAFRVVVGSWAELLGSYFVNRCPVAASSGHAGCTIRAPDMRTV